MSNPLRILETLDKFLHAQTELTLFGRAALALGFPKTPNTFHNTQDVDGILPMAWLEPHDRHSDFWAAVESTNIELESEGLYLTHLFREIDVILQPDWLERRVRLPLLLRNLVIFRPASIDLILTKMARGDEDDLLDIKFIMEREPCTPQELELAFARARVPISLRLKSCLQGRAPKFSHWPAVTFDSFIIPGSSY